MKNVLPHILARSVLIISTLLVFSSGIAQLTLKQDLLTYRDSTDLVFKDSSLSILPAEDLNHFKKLDYFKYNKNYRVKAAFEKIEMVETVALKTSGARTPLYKPFGLLHFTIQKKKYTLTLYQSADPNRPELFDHLLLAFTDNTNGVETYGGGRYLEYNLSDINSEMEIDFNYSFNPYCAYNHKYSCVIPPSENHMNTKIKAGVKKFHDH